MNPQEFVWLRGDDWATLKRYRHTLAEVDGFGLVKIDWGSLSHTHRAQDLCDGMKYAERWFEENANISLSGIGSIEFSAK